jgi:hypothetical protein
MRTFGVTIGDQVFVMKSMSARQFISIQRGEIDEAKLLEILAASAAEHPFGKSADDFLDNCDVQTALGLLKAWAAEQTETALPKVNANALQEVSPQQD